MVGTYSLAADQGTYSLSGQSATLTKTTIDSSWQLASGHWTPQKTALYAVYPRPNSETSSYARHRKAYYDGTNSIQYRVPVGVKGGAYPYHFELLDGPPGMTIGADIPSNWQTAGPGDYGVITWTPTAAISSGTPATVTVRVTDQAGATLSLTWTLHTSSATADFLFLDATGGNNANAGTYASPKQTILGVFGSTRGGTSNPNATIYFKTSGTYTLAGQTGRTDVLFQQNASPMALVGLPGVSAAINFNAAYLTTSGAADDIFLQNLTWDGGIAASEDYRNFWGGGVFQRLTVDDIRITNPVNGSTSDGNISAFYTDSVATQRQHFYWRKCSEGATGTRRAGTVQANSLFHLFMVCDSLAEFNRITTNSGAMFLKESTQRWTRRCNYIDVGAWDDIALGTYCQVSSAGGTNTHIEDCYNTITGTSSLATLQYNNIYNDQGPDVGPHWCYRNTLYRIRLFPRNALTGHGPYAYEDNVVVNTSGSAFEFQGATASYTVGSANSGTGVECHGITSAGIIDTATLALTGAYRTSYLGTRGAEIA